LVVLESISPHPYCSIAHGTPSAIHRARRSDAAWSISWLMRQSLWRTNRSQRLPVPRSSECPAFRRGHWVMGRPSLR
jgi:hypothetical protein